MGETELATVDARGRVQLSKTLREVLELQPGSKVRIAVEKIEIKAAVKDGSRNPLEGQLAQVFTSDPIAA